MTQENIKLYLLEAMDRGCSNGDAYVMEDMLFTICRKLNKNLTSNHIREDLAKAIYNQRLHREGQRIYFHDTWRYEESAAKNLSTIMQHPGFPLTELPDPLLAGDVMLCDEQRMAVETALAHRLTLILGGAGSGKSTLIRAICDQIQGARVLCAPTGKAARNIRAKTGMQSRTIHSALGLSPDDDFLDPVEWSYVQLVIVDEVSMVSLDMLAGLLHCTNEDCRVVLLGDSNQLPSVGAGNVISDLQTLGIPTVQLEANHRQNSSSEGLLHNVVHFKALRGANDLRWDESFVLHNTHDQAALNTLIDDAVRMYLAGENVQVLAPFNHIVMKLNNAIRERVNPLDDDKKVAGVRGQMFRDGDRVVITKNFRSKDCNNGDVGVFRIIEDSRNKLLYCVELPDGRRPTWDDDTGLYNMALAYAMTIHKSQGSEYDTVLMPIFMSMHRMLSRNLFYTCISRGKKRVVLYGDPQAVDVAMQRALPPRKSMLVAKTHMQMRNCA